MGDIWEKVVLVVLAALVAAAVNPWLERVKARTAAEYWEAQERWKFKAQVYAKALASIARMRQPFEVAAIKGQLPPAEDLVKIHEAGLELIEPAVVARLWLSESAVAPLKSLGDRILALSKTVDSRDPRPGFLAVCEMLEQEMERLQELAKRDLQLQVTTNQPWWRLR